MKQYFVYILASHKCGTLYTGITNDLIRRVSEHKGGVIKGFTNYYRVNQLVYFEETLDVNVAIAREKQLKRWCRAWKIKLIEEINPEWKDLYSDLVSDSKI
jgi:putative endonuclease